MIAKIPPRITPDIKDGIAGIFLIIKRTTINGTRKSQ